MSVSLKEKINKTREKFIRKIEEVLTSHQQIEEVLEQLEEVMVLADVGWSSSQKIINSLKDKTKKTFSLSQVRDILKKEIVNLLAQSQSRFDFNVNQLIIMIVGVNGSGKTTCAAKLAKYLKDRDKKVMMVAADTFRAAATEQLALWGEKINIPVFTGSSGADPASVVFDALRSLKSENLEVLIIDTAGRLHTKIDLMQELEKIKRVVSREIEGAPQEVLLVLDATVGQNALFQAKEFLKFSGITGLFLTKLDGTAKGGCVISISDELNLPIKFIGVGENENDILEFSAREFTEALLS
ncbi:MAG: signal recognition particle-docking protein FtsY [Candidatus Aminicenantia bacterium]